MKAQSFQDLHVWQNSKDLCVSVYGAFQSCRDFGFKDQITRAAVSVMNNIAEGFDRRSDKQFVHFLFIARGSAAEVRSMSILASELDLIDKRNFVSLYESSTHVSAMLTNLIKYLKK